MIINSVTKYIQLFKWNDIVDVLIIVLLGIYLMKFIRETRAGQLVKGITILIIILQLSIWLRLTAVNYLLETTMQVGMFAVLVIFQPELRSILERLGRSKAGNIFNLTTNAADENTLEKSINEIVAAAVNMSSTKTGALIVIERETRLGDIIPTGTRIDSIISAPLLETIFFHNTPLHDGAVIIRDNRILSAGCLLQLSSNPNLSRELGTRHRAAIGVSELSDAIVVVVSEETGKISLAINSTMSRNMTADTLKKALRKKLGNTKTSNSLDKIKFWKVLNNNEKRSDK